MQANSDYQEETTARQGRTHPLVALVVLVLGVFAGLMGLWALMRVVQDRYEGRIYPHVHILGADLSGLTMEEARVAVSQVADRADSGTLVLTDGESRWQMQ